MRFMVAELDWGTTGRKDDTNLLLSVAAQWVIGGPATRDLHGVRVLWICRVPLYERDVSRPFVTLRVLFLAV
jgi:hypothetical protein